jgi:NTE family protein
VAGALTRAVVLGGGGPVGRGWQAGLVTGLIGRGVDLASADLILGTSAGAIVGALLATHADLTQAAEQVPRMGAMLPGLIASRDASVRAGFGRAALTAETISEAESLARPTFAPHAGLDWPGAFGATAVQARTGEFRVFRAGDGVPLRSAVAASSALPGVWPPISVGGEQYVDGCLRSMLNADLAAGHDAVMVIACFPVDPADEADIAAVRRGGAQVFVVTPGDRLGEANMLDQGLIGWAYEIGLSQAQAETDRLAGEWPARSVRSDGGV